MAVVVNTNNEQEEKVLLAFLESLKYDYYTDKVKTTLTDEQAQEILTRAKNLAEGKTSTRPWDEIKKELASVYR